MPGSMPSARHEALSEEAPDALQVPTARRTPQCLFARLQQQLAAQNAQEQAVVQHAGQHIGLITDLPRVDLYRGNMRFAQMLTAAMGWPPHVQTPTHSPLTCTMAT